MDLVEHLLWLALPLGVSVNVSIDVDVPDAGGKIPLWTAVFKTKDPGLAEINVMGFGWI